MPASPTPFSGETAPGEGKMLSSLILLSFRISGSDPAPAASATLVSVSLSFSREDPGDIFDDNFLASLATNIFCNLCTVFKLSLLPIPIALVGPSSASLSEVSDPFFDGTMKLLRRLITL